MINANVAALLYLVAGILFILALRGLSSPASSRRGNLFGMVGMTIAILTTLAVAGVRDPLSWGLVIAGLVIGGGIGAVMAHTVKMTDTLTGAVRFYEGRQGVQSSGYDLQAF